MLYHNVPTSWIEINVALQHFTQGSDNYGLSRVSLINRSVPTQLLQGDTKVGN